MPRVGELIEGGDAGNPVGVAQGADVARERLRVAAHVDDPLEAAREVDADLIEAGARRVDEQSGEG